MTDEELRLYRALQKVFKEKMGAEQVGDVVYSLKYSCRGFVTHHMLNVKKQVRVRWYSDYRGQYYQAILPKNLLRLPLPIDHINPERGLWGMISGMRILEKNLISTEDSNPWVYRVGLETPWCPTPTLALLMALARQEGVTV